MIRILALIALCFRINAQIHCYSDDKYEYVDTQNEDPVKRSGEIKICYSNKFLSVMESGIITTFAIESGSETHDKTESGYDSYSFLAGPWMIQIVYEKTRVVVINNTDHAYAYILRFPNSRYHKLEYKLNPDSLGNLKNTKTKTQ